MTSCCFSALWEWSGQSASRVASFSSGESFTAICILHLHLYLYLEASIFHHPVYVFVELFLAACICIPSEFIFLWVFFICLFPHIFCVCAYRPTPKIKDKCVEQYNPHQDLFLIRIARFHAFFRNGSILWYFSNQTLTLSIIIQFWRFQLL